MAQKEVEENGVAMNTYADGEKEPVKWYQGRSGKVSAKRIGGLTLILAGVATAVLAVIFEYEDPDKILWPILSAATLLLGSGVLERFGGTSK